MAANNQKQENILKDLQQFMETQNIQLKGPESADKVYKDECVYCFDTPFEPEGLFVSLTDYVGVCAKHIELYVKKTTSRIFLNIKKFKLPTDESEEPKDKVQRLCIKKMQDKIGSEYTLRFHPNIDVPIEITQKIGNKLREICDLIIAHVSAEIQQRIQSGISEWDGEERQNSKAAQDLVQIKYEGPPIPYEGWVCAEPECGLKENLWINLSDGAIMCGRYAPMSGVNGNGHAKKHYENTGFPLVVKLGTIENGDGDIYSYAEDASVRDPLLAQHLAHFGLDIKKFKKTEKTTIELELDANMKHEFSTIQEEGTKLENVYGPGFTGLINLGSSCYINSALQMLYNVPDFLRVYGQNSAKILEEIAPVKTYEDFNCQLAKVVGAMLGGIYSKEDAPENGIRPTVFHRLAGRGHVEFSTAKQQDAEEYIRHLYEKIDQNVCGDVNPVNAFRFLLVNRFVDELSGCVRYTTREDTILSVPVPTQQCRKSSIEVNGVPRKLIKLEQCLAAAFSEEIIEGYTSPVAKATGRAIQELRMGSFPDFLIIQIRRFEHTETFEVKKLDVDVEINDEIDLSAFFSTGKLQPGENPLPEDEQTLPPFGGQHALPKLNQETINEIVSMGFSENAAKKATFLTKSMEEAVNWVMQHVGDPDFNDPHPALQQNKGGNADKAAEQQEKVTQLMGFGFTAHQAKYALAQSRWDTNAAAEWLLTHPDEVPPEPMQAEESAPPKALAPKEVRNGPGKYRLCAFISHMGSSPHSGHYVAHVKRDDDKWYIFNDEKVAISQNPPKSLGYLYMYKRVASK